MHIIADLYEKANELINEGELDKAMEVYQEILTYDGSEYEALSRIVDLLEWQEKPEDALNAVENLLSIYQTDTLHKLKMGRILVSLNRHEDALPLFEKVACKDTDLCIEALEAVIKTMEYLKISEERQLKAINQCFEEIKNPQHRKLLGEEAVRNFKAILTSKKSLLEAKLLSNQVSTK